MEYNPQKIEPKWQQFWAKQKLCQAPDKDNGKQNYMLLTEFPYPSGDLHMGHWLAFAVPDILSRYLRMKGYNMMYPIGFDAFGLPAENAAIKNNVNPRDWTEKNIAFMTTQFESMGATFDWSRVVSTIDPAYYRWTQWMFLKMFEKGLAYRGTTYVNWCPKDKTVLANEQVIDGKCERDGEPVIQKELEQWMFKITAYADQLIDDMEGLDWPEVTKTAQRNWIGRSQGALIKFQIVDTNDVLEAFTTRPDTLFGATYVVLAPEHPLVAKITTQQQRPAVDIYIEGVRHKTERERLEAEKEKTGVFTGVYAINPANDEKIPVWVADYVLSHYGTGAIMAVPAHDERDREFAKKFLLPISDASLGDSKEIIEMLQKKGAGELQTNYRLRDWVLSRQRYWGVPIPMIHCVTCGYQPVPENDLPVLLPELDDFMPTDDGHSPLAKAKDWVSVKCPKCGGDAQRETDTMDTFVDSSWYFIRYADPHNDKEFAAKNKMKQWLPVPMYIGGAEHNTMHLLYSRFFTKVLHDLGYVDFTEPFTGRRNHGIILGPNGHKMSKSKGNVVNPDEQVAQHGADAVRMYLAFMAPYEQAGPWDPKGINGVVRFLYRVWYLAQNYKKSKGGAITQSVFHNAIKKIGDDIATLSFNTGVSELMKLLNHLEKCTVDADTLSIFVQLLAPFAPHIAEEIWQEILGNEHSVHLQSWPVYDEQLLKEDTIDLPVQINGKVRAVLTVSVDMPEHEVQEAALALEAVQRHIAGKTVKKIIYIPGKMVSIVVIDK